MLAEPPIRHYQGESGRHYQEEKRGVPDAALPWIFRLRAEKFAPQVPPQSVVLEYGVGQGWNLAALTCRRKIGFDIAEFLRPVLLAQNIEYVSETKSIPDGAIDIVLCHHALEHIMEPTVALREMRRLLAVGGKLLLYVPLEVESKYRHYDPDEPNHHLYSWNAQTLGNLVRELDFELHSVGCGEFGYSRFAAVWALKLGLGENGFRFIRRLGHCLRPGREVRLVALKTK
jgi:SAM-dependent methyltransferase